MKRRGCRTAAILLSLVFPVQYQLAHAQAQARCTLAVEVFNSATHAGLARALVSYTGPESGYRFTDSSGNVRVEDVFCGGYSLSIAKPGFVSGVERADWRNALLSPAKRDEFEAEFTQQEELRVIPVQEQVNLTAASSAVRVALLPVSSIDGVVLDENGEPIAGVSVQGIAAKASLTGIDYIPAQSTRTDDRGH